MLPRRDDIGYSDLPTRGYPERGKWPSGERPEAAGLRTTSHSQHRLDFQFSTVLLFPNLSISSVVVNFPSKFLVSFFVLLPDVGA